MLKIKLGIGKRMLAVFLAAAMILTLQGIPVAAKIRDTASDLPQNPVYDEKTGRTTWDYVYFGSYPQTEVTGDKLTEDITGASYDSNGDAWVHGIRYRKVEDRYFKWEKIKWNVLQNNGSTLFVVADKGLDVQPYNETTEAVSWSVCTLRNWLNDKFYNTAFDAIEQNSIVTQKNNDGFDICNDNIVLLSCDDVMNTCYGFSDTNEKYSYNLSRIKGYSEFAGKDREEITGGCNWWLRRPGYHSSVAVYVGGRGYVYQDGYNVSDSDIAVVPALHINLSSDLWSVIDYENMEEEYEEWDEDEDDLEDASIVDFIQPQYNTKTDTTDWDYIYFGSYPQTEVTGTDLTEEITEAEYDAYGDAQINGEKYRRITRWDTNNSDNFGLEMEYRYFKCEPIKWRIMKKYGSKLYVLADTALDCKNYDNKERAATWKDSSIRNWLNNNFYNRAFSSAQRKAIVQQQGTNDNVQLLSSEKAANSSYGFCGNETIPSKSRRMSASDYAYVRGAYTSADDKDNSRENCWWWLRSEESGTEAERVYNDGSLDSSIVNIQYGAVVPSVRIDVLRAVKTVNPKYNVTLDTTEWSYIYFGSYPQAKVEANAALISAKYDEYGDTTVNGTKYRRTGSNESGYKYFKWEPIRWRVLQIDNSRLFLAADMGLDCQKYDEDSVSALWKNSSLRSWLNDTFYNSAFGEGENEAIIKQNVDGTRDNVFILSSDEVTSPEYGFYKNTGDTMSRHVQPSDYSSEMGAESPAYWWLRSSGSLTGAKEVAWDGSINQDGHLENNEGNMVVPALYVNVISDKWTPEEEEVIDLLGQRLSVSALLDCEVTAGESVVFEITASGGIEDECTYQWYYSESPEEDGTAIEGAIQSNYTIESNSVTTSLNGRYYYCVVKNGIQSVVSNRARLTVNEGEKPGENEGEKPGESEGEKPGENEGEKPGESEGEKPGESEGEKPGESEGENEGEKPGENEGEKPGESEGEKPGENEGEKPGGSTGNTSGGSTGGAPNPPQPPLSVSLKTPSITIKLSAANAVKLTWKKVDGVSGYIIYRSESADGTFVRIGQTTGTSFTNKKLKKCKTYYYKITAYKDSSVSGESNTVSRSIYGKPAKPVQKKIQIKKGGEFVISWKKIKNAQKIEIQRSVDGGKFKKWKLVSAKKSKVSYSYLNLPRKHKYSFRVRAFYKKDGIKVYGKVSKAYAIILN